MATAPDPILPANITENSELDRNAIERLSKTGLPHRLTACVLEDADLSRLMLEGWILEDCNVKQAKFTGAKLSGTVWKSCKGGLADFTGCDLSESRIEGCDFNNSNFRGRDADRC